MAMARRKGRVTLLGVTRRPRPALLVSTALCATVAVVIALPARAQPAPNAMPTGGVVFGGNAAISQGANQTTINQASQRAAINWQSFNVGSQAKVQFNQPNASAVTLNRVVGPNPSQIAGRIDANGQVILENQSGVMFYQGSQVNTAGLMVSAVGSSDAATRAFVNGGKLVMDQAPNPNAAVINQGHITIKQAGLAALVAPQVRNDGVIVARLGHVVLASGTETTLDLYGDGMMSVDVSGMVTKLPNGATALVTNTGTIIADGGTVQLTAREADSVVQTLVDAGGKIRANSIGNHTGTIRLAGVGGSITIAGRLEARGTAPGTTGGAIVVNPSGNVNVAATARIDASGRAGGGVVALGTTLKRARLGPSVTATHSAANVTVQQGARIAANATQKGNGGRVAVLSTGTTVMNGTISATGGPQGGDGGFVETSGLYLGMASGMIDVSAPNGTTGSILLDPEDLDIVAAGSNDSDATAGGIGVATAGQGTDITVSGSVLTALSGNLQIEASRNLTIDVGLSFANQAAGSSVKFLAGNNLIVNDPVSTAGGSLTLSAATQTDGITPFADYSAAGALTINAAVGGGSTGPITLLSGTGGITLNGNLTATGQTITLTTTGQISQTTGSITAATLTGSSAGGATLNDANMIGTLAAFTDSGNNNTTGFSLTNAQALQTTGSLSSTGPVTLQTTGNGSGLTLGGTIVVGNSNPLALISGGTISQTGGSISAAKLTGSAVAAVTLLGAINTITTIGDFTSGGSFALGSAAPVSVVGTLQSTSGGVYLQSSDTTSGITVASGGTVSAHSLASFQTDKFSNSGTIIAGSAFELAPNTSAQAVTLGAGGYLAGLTGISASTVRIGAITVPGTTTPVTTAGSISITGNFGSSAVALELDGLSGIGVASGATLSASTLSGSAGGDVDFTTTPVNVGTLGAFSATGGNSNFNLTETDGQSLTVAGAVTATGTIGLTTSGAGTLAINGGVSATAVALTSGSTITESATGTITGTSGATLSGSALDIGGTINDGGASPGSGTLTLAATGGTISETGSIVFGTLTGTAAADVMLTGSNAVGTLAAFAVSGPGHNFSLSNAPGQNLAVTGPVSATNNVALSNSGSGSISVTGSINAGNSLLVASGSGGISLAGAEAILTAPIIGLNGGPGGIAMTGGAALGGTGDLLTLAASGGGITEDAASTVTAGTLSSAGAIGGGVTLAGAANSIGTLTGFDIASGNFILNDNAALAVLGTVTAPGDATLALATQGSLSIGSASDTALLSAGTVSLVANGGTISEDATNGAIAAGLLTGSAAAVALPGSNTVAALGSFGDGGNFLLNSGTALTVVGTLGDGTTNISLSAAGSLAIGTAGSAGAVNGGTVDLQATGGISEPNGSIIAGTLLSIIAGGDVLLTNPANSIAALAGINDTGHNVTVVSDPNMLLSGSFSGNNLLFQVTGGSDVLQIGSGAANATLVAANGGTISLVANNITESAGSSLTAPAGVVELAPSTADTAVTVNGPQGGGGLVLDGALLGEISTGAGSRVLRIGEAAGSVTAGDINLAGSLNLGTVASVLELHSGGTVTQAASAMLAVATLSGTMANGASLLGTHNAIGTLDTIAITSGDFTLADTGGLSVAGAITGASNAALNADTIAVGSSIGVSGTLALTSGTGSIALNSGAVLTGGTVALNGGTGGITLSGNAVLGASADVVDLAASGVGISETGSSQIIAATLQSTGGVAGPVALNNANSIAAIGNFAVTGNGNSFSLTDAPGQSLGVTGTLTAAQDVILTNSGGAAGIAAGGSISAGRSLALASGTGGITLNNGAILTGPTVGLNGGGGTIALNGNALLGQSNALVDLNHASTISEATTATIVAGTLQSSGNVTGTASLLGSGNAISRLGNFAVGSSGNGNFYLADSAPLSVTGVVSTAANAGQIYLQSSNAGGITVANGGALMAANSGEVSLQTDAFALTGNGAVDAGAYVALAPNTTLAPMALGTVLAGTLSLGSLAGITTGGSLVVGGVTSPNAPFNSFTTMAGSIAVGGFFDIGSLSNLVFAANGAVTQTAPLFGAATIAGSAASFTLLNPSNTFTGVQLSASGNVEVFTAAGLNLLATSSSGGNVYIATSNPAGIATDGNVSANGTLGLQSDALSFTSGTLSAPTVELAPYHPNTLVTIGTTGASGLSLPSVAAIGASTSVLRIGAINVPGSGFTITAGSIVAGGDFGGGSLALELDSTGGITQSAGVLTASALAGNAGAAGVTLNDGNAIASLGSFVVSGGTFALTDASTANLAVNGSVSATAETIQGAGTTTINSTITASAGTLLISSGSISINSGGLLADSSGAVDLSATTGNLTENGGSILAAILQSSSGVAGTLGLNNSNAIGTLGNFTLTGGTFDLNDSNSSTGLTVAGAVIAKGVTLAVGNQTLLVNNGTIAATDAAGTVDLISGTSGTIALNGSANVTGPTILLNGGSIELNGSASLGTLGALVDLTAGLGVNESSTATITAATLQSSGGVAGGATLVSANNTIAALSQFIVTGGSLDFSDAAGSLGVVGSVSAQGISITGPGTIGISAGVSATAGTLLLNAGSIAINSNGLLADSGVVDLSTTGGGITENGGAINAGTLQSSNGVAGSVELGGGNDITTLAGFVVNGGSLHLVNGSNGLAVTGSVAATGITLVAGTIGVSNSLVTPGSLALTATAGDITIASGGVVDAETTGTLDLSATSGSVNELGGGTVIAGTLLSAQGVANGITLLQVSNSIGTLDGFTVPGGPLLLVDNESLAISGVVQAQNTIFAKVATEGGSITLGAGSGLTATGAAPLIALVADNVTAGSGAGAITAANGTVVLAPDTAMPVSLGGATAPANSMLISGNLLAMLDTGTLAIGSYSDLANGGALTSTAGNISIDGPVALNGHATTLVLDTNTGAVTESGTNFIQADTLMGTAASGATLTNSNTIGTLAGFLSSGGSVNLNDSGAATLDVTGPIAANGVTLTGAGGATITAGITATPGNILLSAGSIALGTGGALQGGTVDISSTTGTIAESGGSIVAATLLSSGGAHGNVNLADANAIGTLGQFVVTGGTFHLSNSGSLSGLAVTGSVIADSVTLDGLSGTLGIGNSIVATAPNGLVVLTDTGTGGLIALNSGAVVNGPTIAMQSGSVAMSGNAALGTTGNTIDVTTTAGGFTEASSASITGTLQSSGGIAGSVNLAGGNNAVAAIGSLAVTAPGTFSLTDTGNLAVGTLTAASIMIGDSGVLTVQHSLIATNAVSLSATTILIPGEVSDGGAGTTSLFANGGSIDETGGTLIAGTLNGSATAAALLTGNNSIQNVSSFSAKGFTLNDGIALTVGTVIGGTLASIDVTGGTLTVSNIVTADAIALAATSLSIPGSAEVTSGLTGTVTLVANSGSINEAGTLIAGTLTGSAQAGANLAGGGSGGFANQIGTLGNFTVGATGNLILNDGTALLVAGPVNAGAGATITDSQALSVTGSLFSSNQMTLIGNTISIAGSGYVSDGGNGTTDIVANGGTIFEAGTLIAGTLNGSAALSADFLGATPTTNLIANVGSFSANGFVLNDGTALNIGTVIGGTLASIAVAGSLTVNTIVSASTITLAATSMQLPGEVTAGTTGVVSLLASGGTISESGTLIAGTLTGNSQGTANLSGAGSLGSGFANQIGTLGSFTVGAAGSFVLNDATALNVVGPVNAGTGATITDSQALTVTGSLFSSNQMNLTGSSVSIIGSGYVSDGGNGTTDIVATNGTIFEIGTLIAGTLNGTAAAAADFLGASTITNQILNVGSFSAASFELNDGTGLNVGTINGGGFASLLVAGVLTVNGIVDASTIDATAASILIPGTVFAPGGGPIHLVATSGSIIGNGPASGGTLYGSSVGTTDITTGSITDIAGFSASEFTLNDTVGVTVSGPLIATSGTVGINETQSITNNSTIQAATGVSLNAGTELTNTGLITALGGDAVLNASGALSNSGIVLASANANLTGGSVTNSGSVIALAGSAAVAASSGTLQNSGLIQASGSTTLTASNDLTNTGSVIAQGGNTTVTASGTLSNTSLILASGSATVMATTGLSNANTGSIIAQGGDMVMTVSNGSLANAGSIIASGNATLTAAGNLLSNSGLIRAGGNLAGTAGSFANTGSMIAQNGNATLAATAGTLANGGLIQASTNVALQAAGGISNTGSIGASSGSALLTTTGGTLSNSGAITAGSTIVGTAAAGQIVQTAGGSMIAANLIALNASGGMALNGIVDTANAALATGGTIYQNGSLIATTLTGSAASSVNLLGATATSNQVANLGSFTAAGFTLDDGAALAVAGPVNGGPSVTILDASALTVNGSVFSSGAMALTGSSIGITRGGLVSDGGTGTTSVTATAGGITDAGTLVAGTLTGGATGSANLTGASPASNQIAAVANFTASDLTLNDGASLSATGPVVATTGSIAITTQGSLTNNSVVTAATDVTLSANSAVSNNGSIIAATGNASVTAASGALTNVGVVQAGGSATLQAATAVSNTGSVIALGGNASLGAAGGTLANGGLVLANGNASLQAAGDLSNSGSVIAQHGSASLLSTGGALINSGLIEASLAAMLQSVGNLTNTGLLWVQGGDASLLASAGTLSNGGVILASQNATLTAGTSLANSGSIVAQSGNALLTAANGGLSNIGLMSAGGTLSLVAPHGSLTQTGAGASMIAGSRIITSAGGNIMLDGLVKDDTGVSLTAGGNIMQDGTLIADILTGSAGGTVDLAGATPGANQVAQLGNFTAGGGSFILNDAAGLLINGVVNSATIQINDPGQITLGNGGFVTGGAIRPSGSLTVAQLPTAATAPGTYLSAGSVVETGNFSVRNQPGTPESVLAINLLPGGGTVKFGGGGLNTPSTWLILNIGNGSGSGQFNVKAFDLNFLQPAGHADFLAVIGGIGGMAAAGVGFIEPQASGNFRINACPIRSVNCAILSTETLPAASPVNDILISGPMNSQNQQDLILPVVSDERYELLPCDDPNADGACPDNDKKP